MFGPEPMLTYQEVKLQCHHDLAVISLNGVQQHEGSRQGSERKWIQRLVVYCMTKTGLCNRSAFDLVCTHWW